MRRSTALGSAALAATLALGGTAAHADPVAPLAIGDPGTIAVFDVDDFLAPLPSSKIQYDYLKMLTALQGLANRDEPQLYLLGSTNGLAEQNGFDPDQYWLDDLSSGGRLLDGTTQEVVTDLDDLLDAFSSVVEGVVVWDTALPATANVASTAAGIENLLPVRYDTTPGSAYDLLVTQLGLPVALDLTGLFTGTGSIPGSTTPSTGSAKNDAYIWAKERWLDTGEANPTLMTYALDGISWSNAAGVVSTKLPDQMEAGSTVAVSLTFVNTSQNTWNSASLDRLASVAGNGLTWSALNGGYSNTPADQRVFLDGLPDVAPGAQVTIPFALVAPTTPGTYGFAAEMVRDGVSWYPDTAYTRSIEVVPAGTTVAPPVDTPYVNLEPTYPNLYNSQLPNADYYIANKAFFFDLSPDQNAVPNDDPTQPLGTDYATLEAILAAENANAGDTLITIGGFVPWWLKYTSFADPTTTMGPVASEWTFIDIVSRYYAQIDADAYSLIGLFNASVYRQASLPAQLTQNNDKGGATPILDDDTKYLTFYMGDFDSGAWTAGALPVLWNDPARGDLPLAWPLAPGLADRVPQVFDYLYRTQSTNDYFVGGDNGVGYLNPQKLVAAERPNGLPDALDSWAALNADVYDRFDLDLTGFAISGNSGSLSLPVQEAYASFSPYGVGTNSGFAETFVDGVPFMTLKDQPINTSTDVAAIAQNLVSILSGRDQFLFVRNVLITPSTLSAAVDWVRTNHPEIDFEVVDPYTNFALYTEAGGPDASAMPTAEALRAEQAPLIDGVADAAEWEAATPIEVSTASETVAAAGTVWGSQTDAADLTSQYRVRWDDDALYLLEERSDDSLTFSSDGPALYGSDASMFFLDLGDEPSGSIYRDGDYAILAAPESPSGGPRIWLREGRDAGAREIPLDAATIAATVTDTGYTMEIAVPWSALQVTPFAPEIGMEIRFTVLATDNDGDGDWGQIMWAGTGDDQAKWGALRFVTADDGEEPGEGEASGAADGGTDGVGADGTGPDGSGSAGGEAGGEGSLASTGGEAGIVLLAAAAAALLIAAGTSLRTRARSRRD